MCARPLWTLLALGLILPGHLAGQVKSPTIPPAVSEDNRGDDARTILTRYAEAWRGQEELPLMEVPLTLGFEISGVGGGSYHVDLPLEGAGSLRDGPPSDAFQVIFETDIDFLRRLDRGELSAMTALGQARAGDPTPLVPRFPPGFRWTDEDRAQMLPLIFHFWNREWPPVIRFGEGTTRHHHAGGRDRADRRARDDPPGRPGRSDPSRNGARVLGHGRPVRGMRHDHVRPRGVSRGELRTRTTGTAPSHRARQPVAAHDLRPTSWQPIGHAL